MPSGGRDGTVPGGGAAPTRNPVASRALLLGVLGVVFGATCGVGGALGLLAVTTGLQARRDIDAEPDRWTGRGTATAGLVTGVVGLVVGATVTTVVLVLLATGRLS